MRIQTGFEIIVCVETSCHMTKRMSHVRNYSTSSLARAARLYYMLSIGALAMAGGWTAQMTHTLVSVCGQANVQSEQDRVVWNKTICERISITERGSNLEQR